MDKNINKITFGALEFVDVQNSYDRIYIRFLNKDILWESIAPNNNLYGIMSWQVYQEIYFDKLVNAMSINYWII